MKTYTKYLLMIILLTSPYVIYSNTHDKETKQPVSKFKKNRATFEDVIIFSGLTGINLLLFYTLYQDSASTQALTMSGLTTFSLGAISTSKCIKYIRQLK